MESYLKQCTFQTLHEIGNILLNVHIDTKTWETKEACLAFLLTQDLEEVEFACVQYVQAGFSLADDYQPHRYPEELTLADHIFYYQRYWHAVDHENNTYQLVVDFTFPPNGEPVKIVKPCVQFPLDEMPLVTWFLIEQTTSAMVDSLGEEETRNRFRLFLETYEQVETPSFHYHACEKQYLDLYSVECSVEGFEDMPLQLMYDVVQQEIFNISFPSINVWCTTGLMDTHAIHRYITEEAPSRMLFIME